MEIVLSSSSGVPMYEQIKAQVRSAVYEQDLRVGERLPSLRQLAADLRVSIMTVTRAYNDLVAEKIVVNEHGRGFVVAPVDADSARAAMLARLDDAVAEVAAAARGARVTRNELHNLIDQKWSSA